MNYLLSPFSHSPDSDHVSWLRDEAAGACKNCHKPFTIYRRKHHCRSCGFIFCSQCSNYRTSIPLLNESDQWSAQKQRVCLKCLRKLSKVHNANKIIDVFSLVRLSIKDLGRLAKVSRLFKSASDFLLLEWRKLQAPLRLSPQITKLQKRLLKNNACYLGKHPLLKTRLYQANLQRYLPSQTSQTSASCKQLRCRCDKVDKINTAIQVLIYVDPKDRLFDKYLQVFLDMCQRYSYVAQMMLLGLLEHAFDQIKGAVPPYLYSFCYFYSKARPKLRSRSVYFKTEESTTSQIFCQELVNFLLYQTNQDIIDDHLSKHEVYLPASTIKIKQVLFNTRRVLKTHSRPIVVDVVLSINESDYQQRTIMYKQENLVNDFVLMVIARYLRSFDLLTSDYYVTMLDATSGLVLFALGKTLGQIETEYGNLSEFVMEMMPEKKVSEIQDNFIRSCASSSVLELLFGYGDRHLNNIMVTRSGKLLHFDLSYLWKEPLFSTQTIHFKKQPIRLTPCMMSLIGKNNKPLFLKHCKIANRVVRHQLPVIFYGSLAIGNDQTHLFKNFEDFICSSCTRSSKEQDVLIENLVLSSSTSAARFPSMSSIGSTITTQSIDQLTKISSTITNLGKIASMFL